MRLPLYHLDGDKNYPSEPTLTLSLTNQQIQELMKHLEPKQHSVPS